jgi:predicted acylesterase/phospholipase RssA
MISGVSVGAINGALFATHDFGKEKEAVDHLLDLYAKNDPFFEFWPSIFFPPFWKNSILDATGMKETLDRELPIEKPWKRKMSI